MADANKSSQGSSDAEVAEQKRFRLMAGAGLVFVLVLAYFAFTLGDDEAEVATAVPATDSTAVAETPPVEEAPSAPLPPGVSGSAGSGGGLGGGGGGSRGSAGPTRPAGSDRTGAEAHYTSQGLGARAASAFADSAAARSRRPAAPPPATGSAHAARATSLMVSPGAESSSLTVPTGAVLSLSGCERHGSETWCRATANGITGWVRQADVTG